MNRAGILCKCLCLCLCVSFIFSFSMSASSLLPQFRHVTFFLFRWRFSFTTDVSLCFYVHFVYFPKDFILQFIFVFLFFFVCVTLKKKENFRCSFFYYYFTAFFSFLFCILRQMYQWPSVLGVCLICLCMDEEILMPLNKIHIF